MSTFRFVASMTSSLAWPLIVGGALLAFRRILPLNTHYSTACGSSSKTPLNKACLACRSFGRRDPARPLAPVKPPVHAACSRVPARKENDLRLWVWPGRCQYRGGRVKGRHGNAMTGRTC
jgi:hypothetical protein